MANRVWAELMGQGLVDPVDDMRATNPASNEALLEYLANDFRQQGYDLKKLGPTSADYWHLLIEAKKLAFADRARFYADPDFEKVPSRHSMTRR